MLSPTLHSLLLVQKGNHRASFLTGWCSANEYAQGCSRRHATLPTWYASPSSTTDGTPEWQPSHSSTAQENAIPYCHTSNEDLIRSWIVSTLRSFVDHATAPTTARTSPDAPCLLTTTRTSKHDSSPL